MPTYDPQRSRPRRRVADDEGPAPVDALLGEAPVPDTVSEPVGAPPASREPLVIDLDRPAPTPATGGRRRLVLALVALVALVLEVLAWRWWRRRVAAASRSDRTT